MDTLPTELHALICQKACFDNGKTIRALSTVSKYFYEVSRTYLYHTVSAHRIEQVLALSKRLQATPQHLRQIRHLFLSDVDCASSSLSPKRRSSLVDTDTQALLNIITVAAPNLFTFAFVAHAPLRSASILARVFRTSFPFLHSLIISGFYPFPSLPGKFPLLKSLHLNGNLNPYGLLQMGGLDENCPSLNALTVTGLGSAGSFVLELQDALSHDDARKKNIDRMNQPRLPPNIRSIVLQAGPQPALAALPEYSSSDMASKDNTLVGRLDALRSRETKEGDNVAVTVLERSRAPLSPEDVRCSWLLSISN